MALELVSLTSIMALGFVLRLYALTRNGFGNEYYSAGVFSMTRNLHNFFFNAFDPAGILALDKPPLALWVQVASARLFGFQPLSILVPQGIEGMISVVLVWHLVRGRFGARVGLLAAVLIAITPISVAVDRSSNTDSCLVMVLLLAAWPLLVATERGSWRLLLLAMALVGAAFNVKMMAGLIVLPAFALTYWLGGGRLLIFRARLPRLLHLTAGGIVCLGVSLAWIGAVELTPAADRPFVDSSPVNSIVDLVIDHNGLQRFRPRTETNPVRPLRLLSQRVPPGPLRLADPRLASQVGWLLPLAVIGSVAALADLPLAGSAALSLIMWFGWLLTYAAVYSAAGGLFSPYYLVTLAPPLAALAAIGFGSLWTRWRDGRPGWWLLLPTLALTAFWQVWLIMPTTDLSGTIDAVTAAESGRAWLALTGMGSEVASVLAVTLAPRPMDAKGSAAFGLLALLIAPGLWTAETAFAHTQGARPMALLDTVTRGGRHWNGEAQSDAGLADFLRANAGTTRFLAATANAREAAPLIIATGAPVLALGGFQGSIPVVTLSELEDYVAKGQVRFVLLTNPEQRRGARAGRPYGARRTAVQRAIEAWVRDRGVPVDPARWHAEDDDVVEDPPTAVAQLYDLAAPVE